MRKRVVVHGRVQGVFFRESTRQRAASAGVAGWVRNCPDGAVEAVFEGDHDAVERMVDWMRSGPRGAVVERAQVSEESGSDDLAGFSIRP